MKNLKNFDVELFERLEGKTLSMLELDKFISKNMGIETTYDWLDYIKLSNYKVGDSDYNIYAIEEDYKYLRFMRVVFTIVEIPNIKSVEDFDKILVKIDNVGECEMFG